MCGGEGYISCEEERKCRQRFPLAIPVVLEIIKKLDLCQEGEKKAWEAGRYIHRHMEDVKEGV